MIEFESKNELMSTFTYWEKIPQSLEMGNLYTQIQVFYSKGV